MDLVAVNEFDMTSQLLALSGNGKSDVGRASNHALAQFYGFVCHVMKLRSLVGLVVKVQFHRHCIDFMMLRIEDRLLFGNLI